MKTANHIVMRLLSVLLIIAAGLKGWQLLTEPAANSNIWSYRPFLILTVEFELVLGIWLLSGLFKKAAWLAAISCFSLFSAITLYKGITGAESCGCFGSVHVNPWITLFAIDLPTVVALSIFRPGKVLPPRVLVQFRLRRGATKALIRQFIQPLPSAPRFVVTACLGLSVLGVTTPILAFNEPAKITSSYEVLEPETWVGKKLPILDYIDIAESLTKGTWLVLLYHYDCPDCGIAIPKYEQMARDLAGNEDFLQIALIEVPPYGQGPVSENSPCKLGRLADTKEWFVTTPAVALLTDGKVKDVWGTELPEIEDMLFNVAISDKTKLKNHPEYLSPRNRPRPIRDKYCGAYVVWHTLHYYGLPKHINVIVEDMQLQIKDFTSVYEITKALKSYGISSRAVKLHLDKINSIHRPFIPYIAPKDANQFGHFVLCIPTGTGKATMLCGKEEPIVFELHDLGKRDPRATGWDGTSILIDGISVSTPLPKFLSTTLALYLFGFLVLLIFLFGLLTKLNPRKWSLERRCQWSKMFAAMYLV